MSFDGDEKTEAKSGTEILTEWNEQFGDVDLFPDRTGGGSSSFQWEFGVAYPCRIDTAKCVRSKFGDLQIELMISIVENEDSSEALGTSRLWLDLPKQPSDIGKDKELVIKLTQRRYQNLLRVLSAAAPATYALYESVTMKNGVKTYLDFDGDTMRDDDFGNRKMAIHTSTVDFADKYRNAEGESVELLEGAIIYIEKAENKKNEKYPYTNYYATKPDKIPVYRPGGEKVSF